MHDTGLANRIRARGVPVVEIAGWQTRGSSSFSPRGSVNHHTAGAASGNVPSLATCIYGRPDVPGPLCQVLLGRDLVAYVIAAGKANHGGSGGWMGLVGNSAVHGLEIEHTGFGTSPAQLQVAVKIHAAFLEAPGQSRNPGLVCQHFEWAPTRKIDFRDLAPFNANTFRQAINGLLNAPPEDDMTPDQARQLAEVHEHIAGEGRLREVTLAVRKLLDGRPLGFFAATPESRERDVVYYVDGAQQSKVAMAIGSDQHEFIKTLHRLIGAGDRAVDVTEVELPATVA